MLISASLLLLSLWKGSRSECADTQRLRRPWHSLSDEEHTLYATGFQRLSQEGILRLFFLSHDIASDATSIHTTPQNFFWHSYWLWELENSFRRLGTEYECFSMPYWDVTHDADYWYETAEEERDIGDLPIYNSNLGKDGNPENNYCVEEDPWTVADYTTTYLCADDEVSPDCCLKRYHRENIENSRLSNRTDLASIIFVDQQFDEYNLFATAVNHHHAKIHTFIGSVETKTHFNPAFGEPEVDPLFPLFHTFIDYVRLLREDCWEFDRVSADDLDDAIPFSYSPDTNQTLDYVMTFSVLCNDTDGEGERLCSTEDITPRLMYDLSPNTAFGVVYELGQFWSGNEALKGMCADNLNATWWSVEETDTDSDTDAIFGAEERENLQFVAGGLLRSESALSLETSIGVAAAMLLCIAAMALLRRCGAALRRKEADSPRSGKLRRYGTV